MPSPSTADPAPTSHSSRRRLSKGALIAILAAVIVASAVLLLIGTLIGRSAPAAEVGDCFPASVKADDLRTIDCTDPKAAYKVVAVVHGTAGQAQSQDDTHPCARFTDATTSLWMDEAGRGKSEPSADHNGKILCLAPTK